MDKFFGTLLKTTGDNAQGFIHGLLSGLSPVVAERDKQALEHQWLANDEIAKEYDAKAATAFDPQHAAQWQAMATAIRTTPYGKKPPAWATDTYGMTQRQIADMRGQPQGTTPGSALPPGMTPPPGQAAQPSQSAQPGQPSPTLPPPPGSNLPLLPPDSSLAADQAARTAAQPQSAPPTQPAPNPSAAPGQASPASVLPPPPNSTQAVQIGLAAQPGQPGTGFSNGVPAFTVPPPSSAPPTIAAQSPIPTFPLSPYRTPESAASLDMQKTRFANQEELRRAEELSQFTHAQELETIRALSGGTTPITWSTTAAGHTVAKPDLGHPVPGIVLNAKGEPVRLIRYNDPVHYPDREIPVPNYGGKVLMAKQDGTYAYFAQDRSGNIIGEITDPGGAQAVPPVGYAPTVTNRTGQTVQKVFNPVTGQMEDQIVPLTSHTETTRTVPGVTPSASSSTSGLPAPPGKSKATSPAASPSPSTPGTPTGTGFRSLGPTPKQYEMNVENQLQPWAAKNLSENNVILGLVDRTLKALEPKKDDNSAAPEALNAFLYKLGFASSGSDLLNKLNLGSIAEGGRLLKSAGGSRAVTVLNQAREHTPGSLNSFKLMYDKLTNIKEILTDINKYTTEEGRKYPGMKPPPMTPPPSSNTELNTLFPLH